MSPPGYPSAWLHPCRARFRFAWQNHCSSLRYLPINSTDEALNQLAGHYFPTGSPLRQLVLEVRADSYAGPQFREERVLTRKVADQHGTVLSREHFVFIKAATVVSDTRLAPGEKRSETFS